MGNAIANYHELFAIFLSQSILDKVIPSFSSSLLRSNIDIRMMYTKSKQNRTTKKTRQCSSKLWRRWRVAQNHFDFGDLNNNLHKNLQNHRNNRNPEFKVWAKISDFVNWKQNVWRSGRNDDSSTVFIHGFFIRPINLDHSDIIQPIKARRDGRGGAGWSEFFKRKKNKYILNYHKWYVNTFCHIFEILVPLPSKN